MWLWGVGALYLVGRILHALGMDGMMWGRMAGTIITMLTQLGLAGSALFTVRDAGRNQSDGNWRSHHDRARVIFSLP